MPLRPVHAPTTLTCSVRRLGGVSVLALDGRLDACDPVTAGGAVESVLEAVECELLPRPHGLVVDLARAEPSRFVVGLLGLVRRRAVRASVQLVLAALPPTGEQLLERARVAALYPVFPDLADAVAAVSPGARGHAVTPHAHLGELAALTR